MAKNTNELQQRIRLTKKYANIDSWYGVWNSVNDANSNIPQDIRKPGMTVGILVEQDAVEEYWYNYGVEDSNLVLKRNGSDKNYVHNQNTVASEWVITHNLNKIPSIVILDENNNTIIGDIEYININNVVIRFNSAFSGQAILN